MDPERSCRSKQTYLTRSDARRIERLMSRRYREAFRAYACQWCNAYHLGHTVPASIRARRVERFERAAVQVA
jgi:hypothetical protein